MNKVKRFKKKPVEIEAIRWEGSFTSEIKEFCGESIFEHENGNLYIKTTDGYWTSPVLSKGDLIAKGSKGELCHYKPDVFERTYDLIEQEQSRPIECSDESVEEVWENFWKGIVCNPDGSINIEQVKKELADFSFVLSQVSKVYCHITGGNLAGVMYHAETVIKLADDHANEQLEKWDKDNVNDNGIN